MTNYGNLSVEAIRRHMAQQAPAIAARFTRVKKIEGKLRIFVNKNCSACNGTGYMPLPDLQFRRKKGWQACRCATFQIY